MCTISYTVYLQLTFIYYSGRCPAALNLDVLAEQGIVKQMPWLSPHAITVPGAAAGWVDTVEKFGSGKVCLK